jgi:hypothetical protein
MFALLTLYALLLHTVVPLRLCASSSGRHGLLLA